MASLRISALIIALLSTSQVFAQDIPAMNGKYKCDGACQIPGGEAYILQTGVATVCINEVGQISQGALTSLRSISCWGLSGRISNDLKAIDWGNRTQWTR
jgi:hypothetical protein